MIRISKTQLDRIRQHSAREYPNECCGILLGRADGEDKEVREVVPLKNLRQDAAEAEKLLPLESPELESERNRFLIDPRDQIRVEKEARAKSLDVVGYYHSHPDHPARPSNYDREHAWPWYSYVIVSVQRGEPRDLTSWVLTDDRERFDSEQVGLLNP
jgi:proteasome lid subunit RPN8/RPN11